MSTLQRGAIHWFEPDPVQGSEQAGRRPAVLVSRNTVNRVSPVVIVIPLTTYRGQRLYPSDVLVSASESGITRDSVAMGLHIRAVDRTRLGTKLGELNQATLEKLEEAILQILDINSGFGP